MDVLLVRSFSFSYFSSYKTTSIVYEQAKARWNIDHYTPIYCNVHPSALQFKKNGEKNSKKIGQRRHSLITSEEALLLSLYS